MVTNPDWDWKDELYFLLAPFFSWGRWQDFEDFPIGRAYRYTDKITECLKDPDQTLSLGQREVTRGINTAFGGSKR